MSPLLILSLLGCVNPTNPIVALVFLGKNWHDNKRAFRPTAGLTSYAKRQELRKHQDAVKEREREMKQEKEAERQVSLLFNKFECLVFFFLFLVSMFRFLAGGSFCFLFFCFLQAFLSVPASLLHFLGNVVRLTLDPYSGPHPTHQGPSRCEGGEGSL